MKAHPGLSRAFLYRGGKAWRGHRSFSLSDPTVGCRDLPEKRALALSGISSGSVLHAIQDYRVENVKKII
jgi:hypothetical protein